MEPIECLRVAQEKLKRYKSIRPEASLFNKKSETESKSVDEYIFAYVLTVLNDENKSVIKHTWIGVGDVFVVSKPRGGKSSRLRSIGPNEIKIDPATACRLEKGTVKCDVETKRSAFENERKTYFCRH